MTRSATSWRTATLLAPSWDAKVERLANELAVLEDETGGRVYRLDEEQLPRAETKMRDLSKRAAKLGLDEPRLVTVAEEFVPDTWPGDMSGMTFDEWQVRGKRCGSPT